MAEETHKQVQEYYGQRVKSTDQLLTNVCTSITGEGGSVKVKQAIKNVHPEVLSKWVIHNLHSAKPKYSNALRGQTAFAQGRYRLLYKRPSENYWSDITLPLLNIFLWKPRWKLFEIFLKTKEMLNFHR